MPGASGVSKGRRPLGVIAEAREPERSKAGAMGGPAAEVRPPMSGPPASQPSTDCGSETGQGPVNERPRREWGEAVGGVRGWRGRGSEPGP